MRKIIIGLIAVGLVASLFWAYALIVDAEPIEVQDVTATNNLRMPKSNDNGQQTGDTDVQVAKEARYVMLDPETKEVSRIFGFDELLSQAMDTSRRQVRNPYMIFYESEYQCRLDADMGIFQIDSSGTSSTPKDARLSGNVTIHVTPQPGSKISEIVIEMDDLVFSSERSEFATDQKVHIRSEQAELKGTGLIVIFDSAVGKVDFLRIRDLDEIRLYGLAESKQEIKVTDAEKPSALSPGSDSSSQTLEKHTADIADDAGQLTSTLRYYRCTLEDNVKIEYGDEIIVSGADQINIQNILFSRDQDAGADRNSEPMKPATQSGPQQDRTTESKADSKLSTEVLITCDGSITLEPMQDENAEQSPTFSSTLPVTRPAMTLRPAIISQDKAQVSSLWTANFTEETVVADTADSNELPQKPIEEAALDQSPPTKFEARIIDYDLQTGSGLAHGPVRFTFYQQPDPNSAITPIVVTADENALFLADPSQTIKQVVFNGNVMTIREFQTQDYVQLDNLHSEKLTIDLAETDSGKIGLSRLRMTDGKVYVESQRTQQDQKISDIKLYCKDISYDEIHNIVLAEGPGKIELVNNQQLQSATPDSSNPMSQPCVAMVNGFSTIRWNMNEQSIIADGQQDAMKLAYYPILDSRIQKQVLVYSTQLKLSYTPDTSEIDRVFTDKSIIYEEWNGDMTERLHYIVGQTLDYDRANGNGWMKIQGTPAVPCNVDGWRTQEVLVNPVTGEIDTSISKSPGILKPR